MADEPNEQNENQVETRIKELSQKVKLTSEERDEQKRLNEEATSKLTQTEKERDFYASFADSIAQYPQAKDYRDTIRDKVLAGYNVEDAVVATLAKEGKLEAPKQERESPAGGSATTTPSNEAPKKFSEMNRDELKAKLAEAEKDGAIAWT